MTDARLRALYRDALELRRNAQRLGCPSPERLADLVDRRGDEDDRLSALDHVMACRPCAREFELLRAVHGAPTSARGPHVALPLSIAASLLLAVGAGLAWQSRRDDNAAALMRGPGDAVSLIAPAGTIESSGPVTFSWHRLAGATAYDLSVADSSGESLIVLTTQDTVVTVADADRLSAGPYVWWVTARLDDGSRVRATPKAFRR